MKANELSPRQAMNAAIKADRRKVAKNLLWLGIVGMVMLFGGFTSAYVVRHEKGEWLQFPIPAIFYFSTATILLSSLTLTWAQNAIKNNNPDRLKIGVLVTFAVALLFVYLQFAGWKQLIFSHIYLTGPGSSASGQFFYILTFMHLLHLIGGVIALIVVSIKALRVRYSAADYLGVQLASIYWHFLTVLWVYLFLFLYLIR